MPVLEQISKASDKFFDNAESANERARTKTHDLVARAQKADFPLADRLPKIDISNRFPLADRLPEPTAAVTVAFDIIGSGIEFNRSATEKIVDLFNEDAAKPAPKKTTAKKTTAKK